MDSVFHDFACDWSQDSQHSEYSRDISVVYAFITLRLGDLKKRAIKPHIRDIQPRGQRIESIPTPLTSTTTTVLRKYLRPRLVLFHPILVASKVNVTEMDKIINI